MWIYSVLAETDSGTRVDTFAEEWAAENFARNHHTDCERRIVKHQMLNPEMLGKFKKGAPCG